MAERGLKAARFDGKLESFNRSRDGWRAAEGGRKVGDFKLKCLKIDGIIVEISKLMGIGKRFLP